MMSTYDESENLEKMMNEFFYEKNWNNWGPELDFLRDKIKIRMEER